jgi:hypothetical protein
VAVVRAVEGVEHAAGDGLEARLVLLPTCDQKP